MKTSYIHLCNNLLNKIFEDAKVILKRDEIKGKTYTLYNQDGQRFLSDYFKPRELYIYMCGLLHGKNQNF